MTTRTMKKNKTKKNHKDAADLFRKAELAKRYNLNGLHAIYLAEHNKLLKELNAK